MAPYKYIISLIVNTLGQNSIPYKIKYLRIGINNLNPERLIIDYIPILLLLSVYYLIYITVYFKAKLF